MLMLQRNKYQCDKHTNNRGAVMKAIIMAGGKGTRLKPLTDNTPKPLMPILDKPILHYILRLLQRHGITDVCITLGYLAGQIIEAFGDGSQMGMHITYFVENEPLGTAGGVKNASKFLSEDFVVISGDAFTDINLTELINFHYKSNAKVTIAAAKVDNPSEYGVMLLNNKGKVRSFIEKPKEPVSDIASCGIYVMSHGILQDIPSGFCDFAKDVFPKMIGQIYAKVMDCYWSDIGTLTSYYSTNYFVATNIDKYTL